MCASSTCRQSVPARLLAVVRASDGGYLGNFAKLASGDLMSERGKRYATMAELKAAVLAFVGGDEQTVVPSDVRQAKDERDARDIFTRLRAVLLEADEFAKTRRGRGPVADWLRFNAPLRLAPLLDLPVMREGELLGWVGYADDDGILFDMPVRRAGLPPLPNKTADLKTIVEWYEDNADPPNDRELAIIALRVGYWPEMVVTDVNPGATVAHVIDVVRRAVHKLRLGN